jgi:plasmid stabilization system protein ParE
MTPRSVDWWVEAVEDLDEAFQWYETRRAGLGVEFAEDADRQIAWLLRFPLAHPVVLNGIRRAILRRFPYGIYYLVEGETIIVLAVLHLRRDTLTLLLRRTRT